MRLRIRDQLSAFVLLVTLTSIGVLAIITWYNNYNLVTSLRKSRLSIIATLKAEQITSDLTIINNAATALASRATLINALKRYELGNNTIENWNLTLADLGLVISTQVEFLSVTVYNNFYNDTLLNVTSINANVINTTGLEPIYDTGNSVVGYNSLYGHTGFPDTLYTETAPTDNLLLGPVRSLFNDTSYIGSLSAPIYNNTTVARASRTVLGYLTVVFTTDMLINTLQNDDASFGSSGQLLLLAPSSGNLVPSNSGWPGNVSWRYVLPVNNTGTEGKLGGFFDTISRSSTGTGSDISTTNPATGAHVAIGFAPIGFSLVDWLLIIQQNYSEVAAPINHLRVILLCTVFGMAAGVFIVTCILATFAVRPILRLREATAQTTKPPSYTPTMSDPGEDTSDRLENGGLENVNGNLRKRKKWWRNWSTDEKKRRSDPGMGEEGFRVPSRVPDRKHYVTDELTELTQTFNNMTDELLRQYMHLEDRVNARTIELKEQTQLANAANDAKSMFIANVTHELRTPLNGILGMCSVVMTEPGLPGSVRRSLNTIYKSGELLLCLLTDLLTFSRNQVAGANVVLEEKEFKVKDLVTQVKAIFTKTAREKKVELGVEIVQDFVDVKTGEPSVNGIVRGDLNRILQVVINLMSNSLKFTPEKGSIQLRIAMLSDTNDVILPTEEIVAANQRKPSMSPNMPKTAIINPRTPANQAIMNEKAARLAASLDVPSITATPGEVSDSSTAAAYFDPSNPNRNSLDGEPPLVLDEHVKTRWFEFSVIDTGLGIPSHMHNQIFEPFVQGDAGLSKKYGGTGLGLSICKQLAELKGGVIELKSFEGAGSTFTLRIPMKAGGLPSAHIPGNTRPGSLATTRFSRTMPNRRQNDSASIRSGVSTAFSSMSNNQVQDATRLVGLSQPFFAREIAVDDDDVFVDRASIPPPPPIPAVEMSPQQSERMRIQLPVERTTPIPILHSPRSPSVNNGLTKEEYFTSRVEEEKAATTTMLEPTVSRTPSKGKTVRMEEGESSEKPKKKKPAAKATKSSNVNPIRVLVAEDNKVNQLVVKRMLKLEDVTDVDMSEDGQQAVDKVKEALAAEKKYEIIFMDIQMPNVDGLQATKMIREMGYQGPIVALTAFAEEKNVKDCFEVGIDYFLAKPVGRKQLKDVLKQYCPPSPIIEE